MIESFGTIILHVLIKVFSYAILQHVIVELIWWYQISHKTVEDMKINENYSVYGVGWRVKKLS